MLNSDTRILVLGNEPKGVCKLLRWAGYRNARAGSILASPPKQLAEGESPFRLSGDLSLKLALHFKPQLVILNSIPVEVMSDIIMRLQKADETRGVQVIVATAGLTPAGKQKFFEYGCIACYSDKFGMIRSLVAGDRA